MACKGFVVFIWKGRTTAEKCMFFIILVLLFVVIAYLVWIIVLTTHKDSPSEISDINKLQEHYPRFRFPYVAIIREKGEIGQIKCLGAVVNARHVMTLANCFKTSDYSKYEVVLGKYYLGDKFESEQYYDIKDVRFSPRYYEKFATKYSSATILLNDTVKYNKYVCKVYVGKRYQYSGKMVVHGWYNSGHKPHNNNILPINTTTFMMDYNFCEIQDSPECKGELHPKFDKYCVGNLGSPIVLQTKVQQILVGLALIEGFPCYKNSTQSKMLITNHVYFQYDI